MSTEPESREPIEPESSKPAESRQSPTEGKPVRPNGTPVNARETGWKLTFLRALGKLGVVSYACSVAKVGRRTVYRHYESDPVFAAGWEAALERATDKMEREAIRRATKGTSKPVFYKGDQCGSIQEYSDTLLIFMLKAWRPEKYRETFDYDKLAEAMLKAQGQLPPSKDAE